jgi:signal transduction histidine kinase
MSRRLLVAVAVAGAAVTTAAGALVLFAHGFQPYGPAEKMAQVVTGAVWITTGLVAWQRRPSNRVGPLMTGVGFANLAHLLYWDAALPFTIGELISWWSIPLTVHLFLAFPGGRLSTRFERAFVAFLYAATVVLSLQSQLFWDPRGTDCPQCPRNLLLVNTDSGVWSVQSTTGDLVIVAILVTSVVLVVRRVRNASGPTRRAMAPVLVTATIAASLLGVVVVLDAAGTQTQGSVALWVSDVAYAAIPIAFLVGLLRTRLARSAVADLVVELGSLPPPGQLRDAIARCLGDPSLELLFWLPDAERYVDGAGNARDPDQPPGRAVTVLEHDDKRLAALVHDAALLDEPELLQGVGAAASLALENARLQAELRAQLAEVRASRARIVQAGDAERRRLERDLHDGAQQRLLGIRLALQLARGQIGDERAFTELLAEADAEVVDALEELRALARGIHPAILTDEGLAPALDALARRASVPVAVAICRGRHPAPVEAAAYFVAAEALANVAKHAHASRVAIELSRANGDVVIAVADDGIGGADTGGAGLRGLRDRVEALDGRLQVDSPPHGGTRVTAALPCA